MNRSIQTFDVPSGTRPRFGKIGPWALGVALAWLMVASGCATAGPAPAQVPAKVSGTLLVVVNLTNYDWRVGITNTAGGESIAERIQPQATVRINLRGGDYVIEQTVITGNAGPELARHIPARLEPGQTYRWPLVTLLSDSTGDPQAKERE